MSSNENRMLVIIDGSSMLTTNFWVGNTQMARGACEDDYKIHYGNLLQHNGIFTNAFFPMFKQVLGIMEHIRPSHMAIVFDESRDKLIRRQWYPQYKGKRRVTPYALKQQFDTAKHYLSLCGIKVFSMEGFEADDIAGTLAKKFEGEIPVRIITKDHDYLQLVTSQTHIWIGSNKREDIEAYKERYCQQEFLLPDGFFELDPIFTFMYSGVLPEQITDYKGISGDDSDNIPGISGISDKTAIPLLKRYKNIDEIYKAVESAGTDEGEKALLKDWKDTLEIKRSPIKYLKEVQKNGRTAKEMAMLSKRLATIITDVPIGEIDIDYMKAAIDENGRQQTIAELNFRSMGA